MNQHQANGNVPMMNGMPSSGQQTDMTHLWTVINTLSDALAENRAQNTSLVNGIHQIQARINEDGAFPPPNHVNGETTNSLAAQNASLEAENLALRRTNAALTAELETSTALLDDYESSLKIILDKLRPYAFNHQQALLSIHRHYNSLLESERQERLEQSLDHARWQAGLGKVAELAREALRAQTEDRTPYLGKIAELKYENRVLRRLNGWEEGSDSEGEEEKRSQLGQ
ncbi:hypothetical protein EJ05DRAFT_476982 [Pseudovirgaria hyperparasitica]|uniref:Uncharacterized protein n=1 Tax=Pseudovirgaria hyperparasitica TaxID=470096 RepID=A0A6A6W6X0_9PEZI|nr:uncharacterized protein EJ05DRAFT_476982 [Pseudovirgaria hyperparasitica]KAF2757774.1 hypothetical protein EJ05DRAFT_476982 [Pseudovirgaria hyperparasitica]